MAFKYSTGFKNAILDTGSVKGTFDGGSITVYAGTVPADADAAHSGNTALVTFTVASTGLLLASSASGGSISKSSSQTWSGTAGATSTATFFRYTQSGDTGASSSTAKRIQGTVGTAGADMNLSSVSINSGTTYTLDYFALSFLDS